ncbi:MAG: hypothetical protein K9H64_00425 [Bacteroidales bacterium]|nr:hypothetical protein [Bacteroidales bacterium]MCF8454359.1 hypothetical protein [Bacteroidales bacterium]
MNIFKNLTVLMIIFFFAASCEKEIDNLDVVNGLTAPTKVSANFDITQDNTGLVTIMPSAEGASKFKVTFGDTIPELPTEFAINQAIKHNYSEGVFTVGITAVGLTGLTSKIEQELTVTFVAPENLVVNVAFDAVNPRKVMVTPSADFATVMDVYFGEVTNEVPVTIMPDSTATHIYTDAGDFILRVVAKSGGAATTEHSETVTIAAASDPVMLPINFESFTVNYGFENFGNATTTVTDNPDATGINTSSRVAKSVKAAGAETWAGSLLTLGNPIDFSTNKNFKVKTWSPKVGAIVKLKVENLNDGNIAHEVDATTTVDNQWEELQFDFSGIDLGNTYQKVVIFFDFDNVGDGATYYFDDIKLVGATAGPGIVGTWKIAPEAGSLGVGPTLGDISWWSIDAAGVTERACFFDDTYVFNANGTFSNVLGTETWIEGWQGGSDACGTPVAPHDGTVAATYTYNESAGTVTLDGIGAYLGIPKPYNGGELTTPADAPASITYDITLSENDAVMTLDINIGNGWWRFKLVKEGGGTVSTPLDGTWQVAPEAGSLGVGPTLGDISWWSIDAAGVAERACFFDDTYVFSANGSFSNVLGAETWLEDWQGGSFTCGAPIAPHDGTVAATYTYDETAGTVTINGTGAYLGIPKPYNGGELNDPANAPASITYDVAFSENNTVMTVDISIGAGWWRYKMVKI